MSSILDFDRRHLWHPYSSMVTPLPTYHAISADGVRIRLADGSELIDAMSSWWCVIHGYNHPVINAALKLQIDRMSHVMFGGLTHDGAVDLAKKLIEVTPPSMQHVFLADSGSVSVEVAIKMAFQYWLANGESSRSRLLTVRGGYHGDTFAAMSVCDPINGMHEVFREVLPSQIFVDRPEARPGEPLTDGDRNNIERVLLECHESVAAVILEPVVQGAGGMWFYDPAYLQHVRELCDAYEVLLIFDEIATGFGRTGRWFACEHADVQPDIMCVGKAMTGGYISQAAVLTNTRVAHGVSSDGGILMHGPTFMGNPLACAAALASIDLLQAGDWQQNVRRIEEQLSSELEPYRDHSAVADVRVYGAIGVVQTKAPVPVAELQREFVQAGVWIRPFNDLIYVMPPYVIDPNDLSVVTSAIGRGLDALSTL